MRGIRTAPRRLPLMFGGGGAIVTTTSAVLELGTRGGGNGVLVSERDILVAAACPTSGFKSLRCASVFSIPISRP